jgi:hypothetical protein
MYDTYCMCRILQYSRSMICLRPSAHIKQFAGPKICPSVVISPHKPKTTILTHCYLFKNLLVPLFAISRGEKKQVLDGLLTVSNCAILQKRGTQVENEIL